MHIALVFGDKGEALKPKLMGIRDNLIIDCYPTITDLIENSFKRNMVYDRILCTSSVFRTHAVLDDLYKFWSATYSKSEIVVICRAGSDDIIAEKVISRFSAPGVGSILAGSTTIQTIAEAILEPINVLESKYNTSKFRPQVQVETGVKLEQPEEVQQKVTQDITKEDKQLKEKRSILGALFGSGKKDKAVNKPEQHVYEDTQQEFSAESESTSDSSGFVAPTVEAESTIQVDNNDYTDDKTADSSNSALSYNDETMDTDDEYEPKFEDNNSNSNINSVSSSPSVEEQFTSVFADVEAETEVKTADYNDTTTISDSRQRVRQSVTPTELVSEVTDVDFSSVDVGTTPTQTVRPRKVKSVDVEDKDDFTSVDLSSAEEEYRKLKEQPKVVVKTEVREVVRGGNTNIQRILSGAGHKVIVCTGDRGTGVTTTALTLSNFFAEKVSVLYVDCDIQKHGVLNYLDYSEFCNHDDVRRQGVKLCRSTKVFNQCICPMDDNFDLLSSDFSCNVSLDELEDMSATVTAYIQQYGVIIVDCPAENLASIKDLIFSGVVVMNVEASKRGFMNMLCVLENSTLASRYKHMLADRSTMIVTKVPNNFNIDKLRSAIGQIYEPDEIDWLAPKPVAFNGKLDDKLVESILSKF